MRAVMCRSVRASAALASGGLAGAGGIGLCRSSAAFDFEGAPVKMRALREPNVPQAEHPRVDRTKELIAELLAQKAALHPEQEQ
jgi:hypothetical protein